MGLSKSQRSSIYQMFGGRCAYCGHPLGERWHADHVEPLMRKTEWLRDERNQLIVVNGRPKVKLVGAWNPDNERDDNYFPACIPCNIDKSSCSVEEWRRSVQDKIGVALRSSSALRHALRFGMMQVNEQPIIFYFERFEAEVSRLKREGQC